MPATFIHSEPKYSAQLLKHIEDQSFANNNDAGCLQAVGSWCDLQNEPTSTLIVLDLRGDDNEKHEADSSSDDRRCPRIRFRDVEESRNPYSNKQSLQSQISSKTLSLDTNAVKPIDYPSTGANEWIRECYFRTADRKESK